MNFEENPVFDNVRMDSLGGAIRAVIKNDLSQLEELASRGVSLRANDNQGMTPLHHAARLGHLKCLEWLLEQVEVDVNEKSHDGSTPLHVLCSSTSIEESLRLTTCKRLLQVLGVNVNAQNLDGLTPMDVACKYQHFALILELAKRSPNLAKSDFTMTALHYLLENAQEESHLLKECVQKLNQMEPSLKSCRDERDLLPLHVAIISRLSSIAIDLIKSAQIQELKKFAGNYGVIAIAAGRGLADVVKCLLDMDDYDDYRYELHGEDRDITALQMACVNDEQAPPVDYPATIRMLAPNTNSSDLWAANPFQICIDNGAFDSVKALADHFHQNEFEIDGDITCEYGRKMREEPVNYLLRKLKHDRKTIETVEYLVSKRSSGEAPMPLLLSLLLNEDKDDNPHRKELLQIIDDRKLCKNPLLFKYWNRFTIQLATPRILFSAFQLGVLSPEHMYIFEDDMNHLITETSLINQYLTCITIGYPSSGLAPWMVDLLKQKGPASLKFLARKCLRSAILKRESNVKHSLAFQQLPRELQRYMLFDDIRYEDVKSELKFDDL